jgi:hypothetical protein
VSVCVDVVVVDCVLVDGVAPAMLVESVVVLVLGVVVVGDVVELVVDVLGVVVELPLRVELRLPEALPVAEPLKVVELLGDVVDELLVLGEVELVDGVLVVAPLCRLLDVEELGCVVLELSSVFLVVLDGDVVVDEEDVPVDGDCG